MLNRRLFFTVAVPILLVFFYSTVNAQTCSDMDGDGYGNPGNASCPKGNKTDCDDNDNKVYPGAAEICDGIDTNCDGWKPATDVDKDGDGVPMCKNDCNDNNNTVYPGASELCDGIDNNCDYSIPMNERDLDGDGYRTCGIPADCNDNDPFINPSSQEWCSDNKDNNCNGQTDETPCICPDADSDGFTASYCGGTDCDDVDNTIYPGAPELCTDGKDNDCNGLKDCADPNAVNCPAITDADGDGFDVAGICGTPDCDDNDPKVYPGAPEICDGKDSNCDGWKAKTDVDADGDGVPLCASDCDDNNPNRFPGNREICTDGVDNDCDYLIDTGDPDCQFSCNTKTSPKNGPHMFDLLNPADGSTIKTSCNWCHYDNTGAVDQRHLCQRCHADPADTSDPMNGTLKTLYPMAPPYGFGTAPQVKLHSSTVVGTKYGNWDMSCLNCHNPHTQEQNNKYGTAYGKLVKEYVCFDNAATGQHTEQVIRFTSGTGTGSFADGSPYTENICNMCHTQTNHQQADGTAPGGQDHNNGQNCMTCHSHGNGFTPVFTPPPAPHTSADCAACHVTPDTYVVNAAIPNSACNSCHGLGSTGGSTKKLDTHFGSTYNDPTTGAPLEAMCVECHNPMSTQSNLKFIRSTVRGKAVVFTALTGTNSFADNIPPYDGICEVCHTQANHHQNDGTAPGGQSHNDGTNCGLCHKHNGGFQPSGSCRDCHSTQQGNRTAVVGQFSGNSHHVQGVALTDDKCYQCHWEANSDGTINNSYHGGWNAPGSPVNLVIYGNGSRPSAYSLGTTAVAYTAIAGTTNVSITSGNDSSRWPYSGSNQSTANRVYIDNTNPANADGVIDTFRLYVTQGSGTIWIFTGSKSGSTVTPRSVTTVTLQGTNRTNTWTGLNLTVKTGDVIGFYGSTLRVRQDSSGTGSVAYSSSSATPTPTVPITLSNTSTGRLAVYATGTSTFSSGTISRTELLKINQHCLGCHSAQNAAANPFGDGKTPKQYAWDGLSIAERYAQTGTTPWGKYSDTSTTDITPKNTQTKAYSAHGNAAANQRGWDLNETWPNTSGTENVLCFDCHNSHGSSVEGMTTSYTSATANGAILKDTTAGLGGYTMSYKPQAGGAVPENDAYSEGAGICFDCHMTQTSGSKPWGYQNTFGSTQGILGYFDTPYFAPGLAGPQQRYAYKATDGQYKAGHFGASSPLSTSVTGTIGGLCTPCHDPHGVSPSLGVNQQYAVPLLKGTWLTSPYKEDSAPAAINEQRGCGGDECKNIRFSNSSTAGYHIDQNTFANWSYTSTASVSQSVNEFGGLCITCHPKTSLSPDTASSWQSVDRIHNAVKGWDNDGSTMHRYTCSKCHTPHTATLGRLLVTNCLDAPHRGRVATGAPLPPNQSGNGEKGNGNGSFPAGGGGHGDKGSSSMKGPFFFGTTSGGRACHDNENSYNYPDNQLWNTVSPWGDFGVDCSAYTSSYSCNANSSCRWDSNRRQCNPR